MDGLLHFSFDQKDFSVNSVAVQPSDSAFTHQHHIMQAFIKMNVDQKKKNEYPTKKRTLYNIKDKQRRAQCFSMCANIPLMYLIAISTIM